jgi:succinylglutamic semialdehyde dehydrogenase
VTAGQRCSCARRLILVRGGESEELVRRLIASIQKIRIGLPGDEPEAFMGRVISAEAAQRVLDSQAHLLSGGAKALVEMKRSDRHAALVSPGLIEVTNVRDREDVEIFGPLLQVIFVDDFDAVIAEANRTAYGLSAGLISRGEGNYQKFLREVRAGVISWNRPMTGASSYQPFGGVGQSGNHRPGGYFAADYAAYPVAALETAEARVPEKLPPGLDISRS